MRFCSECNNILIPRNKKLYCKACDVEYELGDNSEDFKIVKTIRHDDKETAPIIVKENMRKNRISAQDRKAYEEFFGSSEESGY